MFIHYHNFLSSVSIRMNKCRIIHIGVGKKAIELFGHYIPTYASGTFTDSTYIFMCLEYAECAIWNTLDCNLLCVGFNYLYHEINFICSCLNLSVPVFRSYSPNSM